MLRNFKLDLDSILSSFLIYFLLLGYSATIYVFIIVFSSQLVNAGGSILQSRWVNAIAMTLIALTLLPLRRWLIRHIHPLIFGQYDNPYTLISGITQHLQEMTSPQMTLLSVVKTIALTFKLPYVGIIIQETAAPLRFEFGSLPAHAGMITIPLLYLDERMGELQVTARRASETLSVDDLNLLKDVARQIGVALHVAYLTSDLQASRERIVITREEERRRIRNDLHDGLAPTLSSLQLQIGAMLNLIHQDPDQAAEIAKGLRGDLRNATAEIRRLVYDLRPPMLDDLGLVGAIRSFRFPGSEIRFEVLAPEPMPKLPAAVEVATYRIASEAIHNVIKHAQATTCTVEIEIAGDTLKLSVMDNGRSLPSEFIAGIGIASMKERTAELGGSLSISTLENGGSCIQALIPVNMGA